MSTCETVKIEAGNKQGYIIINKDDFDGRKHKKYGAKGKAERVQTEKVEAENAEEILTLNIPNG